MHQTLLNLNLSIRVVVATFHTRTCFESSLLIQWIKTITICCQTTTLVYLHLISTSSLTPQQLMEQVATMQDSICHLQKNSKSKQGQLKNKILYKIQSHKNFM
jgi:hypothetical protein